MRARVQRDGAQEGSLITQHDRERRPDAVLERRAQARYPLLGRTFVVGVREVQHPTCDLPRLSDLAQLGRVLQCELPKDQPLGVQQGKRLHLMDILRYSPECLEEGAFSKVHVQVPVYPS